MYAHTRLPARSPYLMNAYCAVYKLKIKCNLKLPQIHQDLHVDETQCHVELWQICCVVWKEFGLIGGILSHKDLPGNCLEFANLLLHDFLLIVRLPGTLHKSGPGGIATLLHFVKCKSDFSFHCIAYKEVIPT